MTIKLYDIQQKQVDMSHRNYMLILKQGCGKSYTACGVYEKWASSSPVVVLCPKAVYDTKQWETTLKTYFEGNTPEFEIFKTDAINKLPPDYFKDKYVLIDEGHKYKALSTNRGAKLRVMLTQAEGFCFLTGTPANGTLERTSKGYLLHGGKWEDMANYMATFEFWRKVRGERTIFDVYSEKFKKQPFTYKTITPATTSRGIMQVIRLSARVLRGKQGQRYFNNYMYDKYHPVLSHWLASVASDVVTLDDVTELPEMTEKTVNFKSCVDYKKSLQSYQKDDKIIFDSDMERRAWQRQNQNTKAKCEWLKEFCDDSDENTVIFYNFNSELEALREVCKKARKEIHEINGHSKDKDVLLAKERVNEKGSSNVICLVQVASGGAGLELQGAPIAIWWSLPDSYINFEQSQFRNYRIGQTKKTLRYYLIVSGTVDVSIKKSMDEKSDWKEKNYRD